MKKFMALLLSLILALSCIILPASAAGFTDVDPQQYYYEPIRWASETGLINGMTSTTFEPESVCTRGQVVTMLWRQAGSPKAAEPSDSFTDVKETDYYYEAVLWAAENNIVNGVTAATFEPESPCTRGQVAALLWRMNGRPAPHMGFRRYFTDVPADQYYYEPICWAVENRIANGTEPNLFDPETPCSRAQIVTFLYRAREENPDPREYISEAVSVENDSCCYHLPQFNLQTPDARAANAEIDREFGTEIRKELETAKQGLSVTLAEVGWRCFRYQDILVLLVTGSYSFEYEHYGVWCMDLSDGSRLTNGEILEMSGLTEETFLAGARKTAEAAFYRCNPRENCQWSGEEFEESLAFTLSDKNIHPGMRIYPEKDGSLMLILDVGNIVAGASSYEYFCPFLSE